MCIYLKCIYLRRIDLFIEKYALLFLLHRFRIKQKKKLNDEDDGGKQHCCTYRSKGKDEDEKNMYSYWSQRSGGEREQ